MIIEPEMVTSKKLAIWNNKYQRLTLRQKTYAAAGKAAKASKVLWKMQKLEKKIAKSQGLTSLQVSGAATTQIGGIPISATGAIAIGGAVGARKTYSVQLASGAIRYVAPSGRVITLGYTPSKAKKMYRTKRRRKRLSKRDMAILAAIQTNPAAAPALSLMM